MKTFFLILSLCMTTCLSSCETKALEKPNKPNIDTEKPLPDTNKDDYSGGVVIAEQASRGIIITDKKFKPIWKWTPEEIGIYNGNQKYNWFHNTSEVKPVYNNTHILATFSGGAVLLIRIKDKKVIFLAKAGVNPHSAELMPDGNIITVSSTDAKMCTFVVKGGETDAKPFETYSLPSAHNAVWDMKRELLYTTTGEGIYSYKYNMDKNNPRLSEKTLVCKIPSTDNCGHDLIPVTCKKDMLWMTTNEHVFKFDVAENNLIEINDFYAIKSVSDNYNGQVLMLKPTNPDGWSSDGAVDISGNNVFTLPGTKIYKLRWMVDNTFSYPEEHKPNYKN